MDIGIMIAVFSLWWPLVLIGKTLDNIYELLKQKETP